MGSLITRPADSERVTIRDQREQGRSSGARVVFISAKAWHAAQADLDAE